MFSSKQKKLMLILGMVSDTEQLQAYDAYCEVACEMSSEGMNCGTFADYLERKIAVAEFFAKRNATKSIRDLV